MRDANLQLRSQVFDLNQDIVDLLEIVESLKNRRTVSHFRFLRIVFHGALLATRQTKYCKRQLKETWCILLFSEPRQISYKQKTSRNAIHYFHNKCAQIEIYYFYWKNVRKMDFHGIDGKQLICGWWGTTVFHRK